MRPERLFHELLETGKPWKEVRCEYDTQESDRAPSGGERVRLWVEENPELWANESARTKKAVSFYDHVKEMIWAYPNVFEPRCEIHCGLPCGQQAGEAKVYRSSPPRERLAKHCTKAFEAMVLQLLRQMPGSAVARHVGETDNRLWRMLPAHVAVARPKVDWSEVTCVGYDERSLRRGPRYVSVFCDLIDKRVRFATPSKNKSTREKFVEALGVHNGHPRAITKASIDMSPAYIARVKENLGDQAAIVFAKVHVIMHVTIAVAATKRVECRLANKPDRERLKESRWGLQKNPINRTGKQALKDAGLLKTHLASVKAQPCWLNLQEIYTLPNVEGSLRKRPTWSRWIRWVARQYLRPESNFFNKKAAMIERHLTSILAQWNHLTTNALTEGLSSVVSAVKRKSHGLRSVDNLITMLYFPAENLNLPATH